MRALFNDDDARPHPAQMAAGENEIALAGEQQRLLLVDHEKIDALQQLLQLGTGRVDPQVEGVGRDERLGRRPGELVEEVALQRRLDGAEQDEGRVPVAGGQDRREVLEDVERGPRSSPPGEMLVIAARPVEGLALPVDLQAGEVEPVPAIAGEERPGKIPADDPHQARRREIARGDGRVARRPPEEMVAFGEGRGDPVDADRTEDKGGLGGAGIGGWVINFTRSG